MSKRTTPSKLSWLLLILLAQSTFAADFPGAVLHPYKTVDGKTLNLEVFRPEGKAPKAGWPVIVWWSGGGWRWGGLLVYERQCAYLASRGVVAISAEYRYAEGDGKPYSPAWALEDAKSALRWVRVHAVELGVDPAQVIAAGESSGATMALETALSPGFEGPGEDLSISSKPDAIIAFDPPCDEGTLLPPFLKAGLKEEEARKLIPMDNLNAGLPPTYFCVSDKDFLKAGQDAFRAEVKRKKLPVTVHMVHGQPHGFMKVSPWAEMSLNWVDRFLEGLGYLKGRPTLRRPDMAFDLERPVFGKGLANLPDEKWVDGALKDLKLPKIPSLYGISFAPTRRGRLAVMVSSKSADGFSPEERGTVQRGVTAWLAEAEGAPKFKKPPVFCFMAFPFRVQEITR